MALSEQNGDYLEMRPLGMLEQYSTTRSHLGIYLNVCVTATFKRRRNESLRPALYAALGVVVKNHPSLGVVPIDIETSNPRFVRLATLDLDRVVTFDSDRKFHDIDALQESVWGNAKQTKEAIQRVLEGAGADMPVGYLRNVADQKSWFQEKIGRRRWPAFELSNVGTLSQRIEEDESNYGIESLLFSQSASACSGVLKVSVAMGRDERISAGFTWQEVAVDNDIVQQVTKQVWQFVSDIPE
ncbi:putative alcohol acetyltransferase crmB [Paramyrothecium foliicola]|nr:putative alcohol acetyltransferase crmB [Paramyrothecium foliicola]